VPENIALGVKLRRLGATFHRLSFGERIADVDRGRVVASNQGAGRPGDLNTIFRFLF
jgi:hypothetical protein